MTCRQQHRGRRCNAPQPASDPGTATAAGGIAASRGQAAIKQLPAGGGAHVGGGLRAPQPSHAVRWLPPLTPSQSDWAQAGRCPGVKGRHHYLERTISLQTVRKKLIWANPHPTRAIMIPTRAVCPGRATRARTPGHLPPALGSERAVPGREPFRVGGLSPSHPRPKLAGPGSGGHSRAHQPWPGSERRPGLRTAAGEPFPA